MIKIKWLDNYDSNFYSFWYQDFEKQEGYIEVKISDSIPAKRIPFYSLNAEKGIKEELNENNISKI